MLGLPVLRVPAGAVARKKNAPPPAKKAVASNGQMNGPARNASNKACASGSTLGNSGFPIRWRDSATKAPEKNQKAHPLRSEFHPI